MQMQRNKAVLQVHQTTADSIQKFLVLARQYADQLLMLIRTDSSTADYSGIDWDFAGG